MGDDGASVLILALWTLFFLAVLALAVGAHVSAGIEMARRLSADAASCRLACAAIERAVAVVASDTNQWDSVDEVWRADPEFRGLSLAEGTCGIGVVATLPDGTATTNSGLVDEESKVNLNAAKPPLLAALLETAGGMAPAAAADAAAAMADWVDPDHEVLTGGAEDDYYARLEQPYDCHDGSFQSVYELRLVRGIGAEVLARIADKVTVFGTGKININTASAEVLRAVAVASGGVRDVADALAARILRFRDAGNVFGKSGGAGDVSRQLGEFEALRPGEAELLRRMAPYLGVYSSCFGGSAWGRAGAGPGGESRIEFVFERDTRQTVFWHEF